jgi:hypothetical protein
MSEEPKAIDSMKDHDILTTLVANVDNLARSQESFHRDVKESFKELKDNYSSRLDKVESEVSQLKTVRNIATGVLILASVCSGLLLYIYFNEQGQQDVKLDNLLDKHK